MSSTKTKLDTGLVRELAAILREADLGELEVEHEGTRVRVTKAVAHPAPVTYGAPQAAPPPVAAAATAGDTSTGGAPGPSAGTDGESLKDAVTSPMVGTCYLSPEPGASVFVNEGDKVEKGQTLMLVEAMKTFNPVEAPRPGTVTKILVTDAQPVEFGEPLLILT